MVDQGSPKPLMGVRFPPALPDMTARKRQPVIRILLVATAAVMVWRGAWGLMDLYVFPNDPFVSYVISLIVGLAILFATQHLEDELI